MTLIDMFRSFSRESETKNYPASARIAFYTLLNAWNESRREEVVTRSRADLIERSGMPEATFRWAISFLSNHGWVKVVNRRPFKFTLRAKLDNIANPLRPQSPSIDAPATESRTIQREKKPPTAAFSPTPEEVGDLDIFGRQISYCPRTAT